MIDRILGSFRITGKIGSGGMGDVYSAVHTLIGKHVAIKVLRPELSANTVVVTRFFNEAKATSAIEHPGIVEVFDFGYADDGTAYIVMEHLRGQTLGERLKQDGPMKPSDALRLVAQLASALKAAHGAGIVHRDLKPSNLFLVKDPDMPGGERLRVLDFGVAKLANNDSGLETASGALIGTPVYMSPEQCRGAGGVDHRADLYAVGCILYEAVCGQRPFTAQGRGEMIAMHLFDTATPPSQLRSDVPPAVEQLITVLLKKEPAQRPASADELLQLVRQAQANPREAKVAAVSDVLAANTLAPLETTAHEPAVSTRSWWKLATPAIVIGVVGAVGVVGVGVVAVWLTTREPRDSAQSPIVSVGAAADAAANANAKPTPPPPIRDAAAAMDATAPVVAAAPQDALSKQRNRWLAITTPSAGAKLVLGVHRHGTRPIATNVSGLRPSRQVLAPTAAFELQQHEVTWGEIEPWLATQRTAVIYRPAWLPKHASKRAQLPATGIPWDVAYRYCRSVGGNLPTEEQWELAARGVKLRPHSWGVARIDLARTRAYQGRNATLHPVTDYDQDVTPGPQSGAVMGLISNAREWTASLWRENMPGKDESWVQQNGNVFRVVRGLPFGVAAPKQLPVETAAFRDALCAAPACLTGNESALQYVGFRCARPIR